MGEFSVWHLLILAAVFVLLFGYKRLPDATRSLGRSLRIFKAETRGLHDDGDAEHPRAVEAAAAPGPVVPSPAPAPSAPPVAATAPVVPVTPTAVSSVPVSEPRDPADIPRS